MMPSTEKLAQGNGMMSGFLATAAICGSRILQNEVSFSTLTDKMKLKFIETPTDEFYNTLDSLSNIKNSNWQILYDGTYFFYKKFLKDETLSVSIDKGNRNFDIVFCGL
jgi:hypothetical protein